MSIALGGRSSLVIVWHNNRKQAKKEVSIQLTRYTLPNFPDYEERAAHLASQWADFIYHEVDSKPYYPTMVEASKHLHFFLVDETDYVVAHGQALALHWDGSIEDLPLGWSDAIKRCVENHLAGVAPNTLCGVSLTVAPNKTGLGLGSKGIEIMRDLATENGYDYMIAPVRPSQKSTYPLIPMEEYITWTRDDGLLFDKWLRIHQRLGASILKVAPHSMRVVGTVAEWEEWSGRHFPESGLFTVDGALCPILIDVEADEGQYVEPNVWMQHTL